MDREKREKEALEKQKEKEKAEQLAKGVKFKLKKAKEQDSSTSLKEKTLFKYDDSSDEGKILQNTGNANFLVWLNGVNIQKNIYTMNTTRFCSVNV